MKLNIKNLSIFNLAFKSAIRFKWWFALKIVVLLIYEIVLMNSIFLNLLNSNVITNFIAKVYVTLLITIIMIITFLFLLVSLNLNFKVRETEFVLLRSIGVTRFEIFLIILNEIFVLTILSFFILLIVELFAILKFKLIIMGLAKTSYDYYFLISFLKAAGITFLSVYVMLFFSSLPSVFKYTLKSPFEILRT